ncbi:hypothetical protein BDV25DRAFT_153083 [Aspergillus avenaceus]|uniref:Uncharacterized protein n=1 Tax=Aspergillus avenaceus TaxID=36643 RepID=A0A5N6TY77_ASPAV|nr:hypothetical protein BDV25DRAFT_153083 [Aspergillus avenaceus]
MLARLYTATLNVSDRCYHTTVCTLTFRSQTYCTSRRLKQFCILHRPVFVSHLFVPFFLHWGVLPFRIDSQSPWKSTREDYCKSVHLSGNHGAGHLPWSMSRTRALALANLRYGNASNYTHVLFSILL